MRPTPKRVLVVDDMATLRHILMVLLKNEGFESAGASNGRVALDMLSKRSFDLVLCDWNMPGMNGTELVRKIRAAHKKLPIVMVTAEDEPERVMELRKLGVAGYIIKPFKPQALKAVLRRLFPA